MYDIHVQVPIGEPLISLPEGLPLGWYDIVSIEPKDAHDVYILRKRAAREQVA